MRRASLIVPQHGSITDRRRASDSPVDGHDGRATMSVPEAAELLGISESATYEACARGEIPTIRIGRRVLVVRDALTSMLNDAARHTRSQAS